MTYISKAEFLAKQESLKAYRERKGASLLEHPCLYEFQQYETIYKELDLIAGLENVDEENFADAVDFTVGFIAERFCNGEYEGSSQAAAKEVVTMLTGQTPLRYLVGSK